MTFKVCQQIINNNLLRKFTYMYGKIFESMFTGSLAGKGAIRFAVWSYVIAHQRPRKDGSMAVELNALVISGLLGEGREDVQRVIDEFCEPDPLSRSQEEEGRRLVREGTFLFRVVNGAKYRQMRQEEERREYQRVYHRERRQREKEAPERERRQKMLLKSPGTLSERLALQAEREGDEGLKVRVNNLQLAKQRRDEAFARTIQETIAQVQAQESVEPTKESLSENGGGGGGVPPEGAEGERFPEV